MDRRSEVDFRPQMSKTITMQSNRRWLAILTGSVFLSVLVSVSTAQKREASVAMQTFDKVWQTINTSYYDPEFGGLDWKAIGEKYRPRAAKAKNNEALRDVLNQMLGELGDSHFGVIPGKSWMDELAEGTDGRPAEKSDEPVEKKKDDKEIEDSDGDAEPDEANEEEDQDWDGEGYTGMRLRLAGNALVVAEIRRGSPAEKAGLRMGQEIKRIGKRRIGGLLRKRKAGELKGMEAYLLVRRLNEATRARDGVEIEVEDRGDTRRKVLLRAERPKRLTKAFANMDPMPLVFEKKFIGGPRLRIMYLRFSVFFPDIMSDLREALRETSDCDGVVFDVRDNPGGLGMMASGIGGMLTEERFSLGTMKMRAGEMPFNAFPQQDAFLGPVAILVDEQSASTSEIFAAGLQEHGRARVFGRQTPGLALPSFIVNLPNGDRLQHAVADFVTPGGTSVEGSGVTPDVVVRLNRWKLLNGRDVVLERAVGWIRRKNL